LSLPIAARGEKEYLSAAWEADSFDFERACRAFGRNDSFWVLCYRAHLAGEPMPDERETRKIVRAANRATGGLNQQGERERYTLYEARATIDQVRYYQGCGLRPLIARRRVARRISPQARRLLETVCGLFEASRRTTLYASHRKLGEMADLPPCRVAAFLNELERNKLVFRRGFTPAAPGRSRGTTILSLRPPRPMQNIDEAEPPTWNPLEARWTWSTPLAKGTMSYRRWCWLARRQSSKAANVPYVYEITSSTGEGTSSRPSEVASAFQTTRGSP
jgi:hypothetical protein